jgi:hypothetical protein
MFNKKDAIVCIGIFVVVFTFFGVIGTFTSGYHLTDDFQVFEFNNKLEHQSLLQTQIETVKSDLKHRFRPLYYPHRILQAYLFGYNTGNWLLYTAFLGCISMSLFFLGMRKFKCSVFESLLFICLLFIGEQIVVWMRIDPNETLGMFFLAFAFYFMVCKTHIISTIFFSLFLILASLCKESFTLAVPAFLFLKIFTDKQMYQITIKQAIRKNIGLIVPFLFFLVNVLFILLYVNKSELIYIGVDNDLFVFIKNIITLPFSSKWFLYGVLITIAIYLAIFIEEKDSMLKFLNKKLPLLIFFILFIFPQIILHAKASISERYLLPVLFSTSFVSIITINNIKNKYAWLYKFLLICVSLSIIPCIAKTYRTSLDFVTEGKDLKSLYKSIEENLKNDSNILLVTQPDISWEECVLSDNYISHYFGKTASFLFLESELENVSDYGIYLTKDLISRYNKRVYSSDEYYDIIVFFNMSFAKFSNYSGIDNNIYFLYKNNTRYPVYISKIENNAK